MNLLIIIPAYNEEKNIKEVLKQIRSNYSNIPICVINDCSNDNTVEVINSLADNNIFIISHIMQQGYGVAIQTGYKYAIRNNYEAVLQLDADGQHDPIFIEKFIKEAETDKLIDVFIGSRFNSDYKISSIRLFIIMIFRFIIKLITGVTITDPTSGFQLLRKKVLHFYCQDFFPSDFPDANIVCWAIKNGFSFKEIPVKMHNRIHGKAMHKGFYKNFYYLYKVLFVSLLSIFLIRKGESK